MNFYYQIDKCFQIKKTTFYSWLNNDDIINSDIIFENNNKLINNAVETYVVNLYKENNKIGIKTIKNKIKNNFKFVITILTECSKGANLCQIVPF